MGLSGQVGISRSPFPGLLSRCSGMPGPSPCHPEPVIFLILHTVIWNKRDPFPKQSLKTSRQLLFNTQDPSPALCPGSLCCLPPGTSGSLPPHPNVLGAVLGLRMFFHMLGWNPSPLIPTCLPRLCPSMPPPPPTSNCVSFTAGQPCSISLWVRLSPHTSSAPQQSGDHPPLCPIPVPPPHFSLPPHSCAE